MQHTLLKFLKALSEAGHVGQQMGDVLDAIWAGALGRLLARAGSCQRAPVAPAQCPGGGTRQWETSCTGVAAQAGRPLEGACGLGAGGPSGWLQAWSREHGINSILPGQLPRGLRAGASRAVLFRDGRGFHEISFLPGEHDGAQAGSPRGRAGSGGLGVSALQLPALAASGPHCRRPPPPQLSGPRDRPGRHWRALPATGKGFGEAATRPRPRPFQASACSSAEWARR